MSFVPTDPTIMGVASFVVILALIYLLFKKLRPRREVMYLRERDKRGQRLAITEETATTIYCRRKKGSDKRFFKWGSSYIFHEAGKMITRFFAKEGTAYTYKLRSSIPTHNPGEIPDETVQDVQCISCGEVFETNLPVVKIGMKGEEVGPLKKVLLGLWGQKFFNEIPEKQKKIIEDNKIFVTVELESGLTPAGGFSPMSEEDIKDEDDRKAASIFAKALGPTAKQELYKGFLWASLGALMIFIAYNFGIFT